ncbi:MAG: SpoIIE family protein phosphatase [Bacteroidota bacterium]
MNISGFIEDKQLKKYTGVEPGEFYLLLNDLKEIYKDGGSSPDNDDLSELSQRLFMGLAYIKGLVPVKELMELFEISENEFNQEGKEAASLLTGLLTKPLSTKDYEKYEEIINYYQYRIDKLGGVAVAVDATISTVKSELRKKNNGLSLLNELQNSIDAQISIPEIFETTLKKLNVNLRMDVSAVLMPVKGSSSFHIEYQFGSTITLNTADKIVIENLTNKSDFVLINKQSEENDFSKFIKEKLGLPFFVAVPIFSHNSLLGILVSGRLKELKPFFPQLNDSDVDLLKSLAAFISVSCTNANLYSIADQLVQVRTDQVVQQKKEIELKNNELEILFKHVTDSIHYAKNIQEAILPPTNVLNALLPDSFVLYKPKDIVSGDFYWVDKKDDWVYFAAVDCTGHGVPGAFMSIVGYNLLKDILMDDAISTPAQIMDKMNIGVSSTFHRDKTVRNTKDGMDMTLCAINFQTMELQYASAFNPLYIIRNNELTKYKADKFPVGMDVAETKLFTNNLIKLQKGDTIYIASDGYADQFGGPKGKKFMVSNFRNLLLEISKNDIETQNDLLNQTIGNWKGSLEQVDDILVMGLRV